MPQDQVLNPTLMRLAELSARLTRLETRHMSDKQARMDRITEMVKDSTAYRVVTEMLEEARAQMEQPMSDTYGLSDALLERAAEAIEDHEDTGYDPEQIIDLFVRPALPVLAPALRRIVLQEAADHLRVVWTDDEPINREWMIDEWHWEERGDVYSDRRMAESAAYHLTMTDWAEGSPTAEERDQEGAR